MTLREKQDRQGCYVQRVALRGYDGHPDAYFLDPWNKAHDLPDEGQIRLCPYVAFKSEVPSCTRAVTSPYPASCR